MSQPFHILNQLGIITSFSVAKKISDDEIDKFFAKYRRSKKTTSQIEELFKQKVISDIDKAVQNYEVPGLITPQEVAKLSGMNPELVKNIPDIDKIVDVIAEKMLEKTTDKMSLCYFINSLVNKFDLSEDDFFKFHKNNNTNDEDDEDGEDGDDDEFSST
jgi:hypothetical protein